MAEPRHIADVERLIAARSDPERLAEAVRPLQAFDLAELVRRLDRTDRLHLLTAVSDEVAAGVIEYLEPELQYRILHHLDDELGGAVLRRMSSDTVVDLLLAVHPRQAVRLKKWLPSDYRQRIDKLMTFPENAAGSLATVDYIAARAGWTVGRTLDHIRKVGHEAEVVSYIYVVDAHGKLIDVVSLRELILADPARTLDELVSRDVIAVPADSDKEEAARVLSQYDLLALPVVDARERLVGIVTVDDLFDVIQDEATEDIHRLGGSEPLTASYFQTPVAVLFRKRIVWLSVLFLAQAYTGTVMQYFEATISQVVALAFFIPLLIGTGGNTGSQIVSTLVRGLAIGEVAFGDMVRVVRREIATGALLGLALGAATYVRAAVMGVGWALGPVVGISALLIVIWASAVAAMLPLILHRLKVDPAVVSGPFITTIVDGTGLFLYFSIARLMLGTA